MGLMPTTLPCDLPDAPSGCAALFDMGEDILDTGMEALEPFMVADEGCPDCPAFDGFVSHGEPPIHPDHCDVLAVWLVDFAPYADDQKVSVPGPARGMIQSWRAHWRVELWEDCYPLIQGDEQPEIPELGLYNEIHRHIYAHGLALYNALFLAWRDNTIFGDGNGACIDLLWGQLTPIEPRGTCAGWAFDLTGELP